MKICRKCEGSYPNDYDVCPKHRTPLETASKLAVGMKIRNKWLVLGQIGSGGMATVYKVQHTTLGTIRAIKVIHAHLAEDADFLARFKAEAVLAKRLEHPNEIRIDDLDTFDDSIPFIVMEYVEGRDLKSVIKEGRIPVERALDITTQVAFGLGAAHGLSIIHRDVKPDNILLSIDLNRVERVKVTDFGIAKALDRGTDTFKTKTGFVVGTPNYMSPEQLTGPSDALDVRSDLYSLGVVLYEMLTGQVLFPTDKFTDVLANRLGKPPRVTGVPPSLGSAREGARM